MQDKDSATPSANTAAAENQNATPVEVSKLAGDLSELQSRVQKIVAARKQAAEQSKESDK